MEKTDAWNDPEYRVELFKILVLATSQKEWSLTHQISILDNVEELPVKNNFYKLHKIIHFYTQNNIASNELPKITLPNSPIFKACQWIISLIQNNENVNKKISDISNSQENKRVDFNRVILDALEETEITIEDVVILFYDNDYNFRKYGLNELLRIFFSQPEQISFELSSLDNTLRNNRLFQNWINKLTEFCEDYQNYFFAKYFNFKTGKPSINKFKRTIHSLVSKNDNFYSLLSEIIYNTNQYIKSSTPSKKDKWSIEELMTNPLGNDNRHICVFTIKFLLKRTSIKPFKELLNNKK